MRGCYLFAVACAFAVVGFLPSLAFAVDAPITPVSLGIDWTTTVTSLAGTIGGIVVACLGLWAGLKMVQVAKRFVGGAIRGR